MAYEVDPIPYDELMAPVVKTTEILARLDECLRTSPVRAGWIERTHFSDSTAALWLEGELVHLEDLVLHDERMDIRAPTHELTRAHGVLRARRRIFSNPPDWALSLAGLRELSGFNDAEKAPEGDVASAGADEDADRQKPTAEAEEDPLAEQFAALDAVLERTSRLLDRRGAPVAKAREPSGELPAPPRERPSLIYDLDWDEDARMQKWISVVEETQHLPVMLRAAIALDAWGQIEVLQHGGWLGGLLVASLLRREGLTAHHLACLHLGSRNIARERRRSPDRTRRIIALLGSMEAAAELGMKEHDRLILAKTQMERRLKNRRSSSKLPGLITLVLSRPLVSTGMIQKALNVTQQGAFNLVEELSLREMTGRKRFRAWGVL